MDSEYTEHPGILIEDLEIGMSVVTEKTIGESDVYLFSGITGDFSANHINERYMQATHYGHRLAQAALMVGLTSGAGAVFSAKYRMHAVSLGYDRLRFIAPVFIGDTIRVSYTLDRLDVPKSRAYMALELANQEGTVVMVGHHLLKVLPYDPSGR
ncbi:MaoC/PaaZ C-terminal domain-containing protein [Nocardioides sp.]|uniref:MaoC family dehydratase n=1 Tax=Nocardioides sp. TaxID=35761 RepID=UPI002622FC06|nr:MaoC/PaaZ C-terminal domain-containing protein [Nocardioides sp.]MDI6912327.1 MaoC/PaaZ C-terminal domain-containing protein [Nocardioides sp.]